MINSSGKSSVLSNNLTYKKDAYDQAGQITALQAPAHKGRISRVQQNCATGTETTVKTTPQRKRNKKGKYSARISRQPRYVTSFLYESPQKKKINYDLLATKNANSRVTIWAYSRAGVGKLKGTEINQIFSNLQAYCSSCLLENWLLASSSAFSLGNF